MAHDKHAEAIMTRRSIAATTVAGTILTLAQLTMLPVAAQGPEEDTVVEIPSAGISVALPADWLVLQLGDDPAGAAAEFSAAHPELAEQVSAFMGTGPMAALAIEPPRPDDVLPATFGAFRGPNIGMTTDSMLQMTVSSLPMLPGVSGEITSESLVLGGQPAFAVGYDWELQRADGTATPVRVEQFTIVSDDTVWVFSVTDDEASADAWRGLASSFAFLP